MAEKFTIRPEQSRDHEAIYDITKRAFAPMPFAEGNEQDLINTLRDNDALIISLVAQISAEIVGHIAFTRAFPENGADGYYALGPVAVDPELQQSGIGSALINAGIDMLRDREAICCILIGDTNYYNRFGFKTAPHLCPDGEPEDHYMILPLGNQNLNSVTGFHPLFHS